MFREGRAVTAYTDELVSFFMAGKPPGVNLNPTEELAAAQRISALQKQFPRTPAEVLADLEQDSSAVCDEERFYALTKLAKAAWQAGALEKASQYAGELVSRAQQNTKDWNYEMRFMTETPLWV